MKISELLDSHEKWTKGFSAVDAEGKWTDPTSEDAVQWCLIGALWKCYPNGEERVDKMLVLQAVLEKRKGPIGLVWYNDCPDRTFEDIQMLLKEAGE